RYSALYTKGNYMRKVFVICVALLLCGCAHPNFSLVAGDYGWVQEGEGGSEYYSSSIYRINHSTGETYVMQSTGKGFKWVPIQEHDQPTSE
ncbi:MAG: hypothetical protein AAF699_03150, partial [Pseudomonadota bacterium]